jgi:hypothetical protein
MPIPPPPPRQLALSLFVKHLHLRVPQWVGLVALAVLVPSGAWMALGDSRSPSPVGPVPAPVPQAPLQAWTSGAMPIRALAVVAPGKLPPPLPSQKTVGCDDDLGEKALEGGCWMPTDKEPPCPKWKLWEHEGRCWRPIPKSARAPTTGEPRTHSVAAPRD